MSPIVLAVGHDPDLLMLWVGPLAHAGYRVHSTTDATQAARDLCGLGFDLLLICRSVPDDDRRRLALILHTVAPHTPVLLVSDVDGIDYESGVRRVRALPGRILAAVNDSLSI